MRTSSPHGLAHTIKSQGPGRKRNGPSACLPTYPLPIYPPKYLHIYTYFAAFRLYIAYTMGHGRGSALYKRQGPYQAYLEAAPCDAPEPSRNAHGELIIASGELRCRMKDCLHISLSDSFLFLCFLFSQDVVSSSTCQASAADTVAKLETG